MDVGTFGFGPSSQQLLDITVRHAGAVRYADRASSADGATADRGRRDEHDRYGELVTPLVHESWGRLGDDAEALLVAASEAAARLEWRRGQVPGNRIQRWRAQLDADLQCDQAAMQ